MYKNAKYRRTAAQDNDISEDDEFLRKNRAAAGIYPRVSDIFYQRVIFALIGWPKKRPSAPKIAEQLNGRGILNANEEPWTPTQIKMFVKAHFPKRKQPL